MNRKTTLKIAKTLDFLRVLGQNGRMKERDKMFDDLFDFGKKRTLKQSVGFFLFHTSLVMTVFALLNLAGIS
jgi:hypothetical protein